MGIGLAGGWCFKMGLRGEESADLDGRLALKH